MRKKYQILSMVFLLFSFCNFIAFSSTDLLAQTTDGEILKIAKKYIESVNYCCLITVDSSGQPHAREMDPFPPEENMVVYLGTNKQTRKVLEIKNHPQVTLYYSNDEGMGYVSINGKAALIEDKTEKNERWKKNWEEFYGKERKDYILIKVIPEEIEIVNYENGLISSEKTWKSPSVKIN